MFSWDEGKRSRNIRKHGIDFVSARRIFEGFTLTAEDRRDDYGEQRFLTLGMLEGQVVSVCHTESDEEIRIISIRKATRHEANFYISQVANRSETPPQDV